MQNHNPKHGTEPAVADRSQWTFWIVLIGCVSLGVGWLLFRLPANPPLQPVAKWSTQSRDWQMPMPDRVHSAGVAANDIRFEQNGKDLWIAFRNLTVEKHPSAAEVRIVAVAVRINPSIGSEPLPQPMEGVLTDQRPTLRRTTVKLSVPGAVTCLKTGTCTFWVELTVQRPGGPPHVEQSQPVPVPQRPTV